jgi:hypothetical protein
LYITIEYTTCLQIQTQNIIILNLGYALIKPWLK